MKALVKKYSKKGIWMDEIPKPQIQDNEVLIKIKQTAICGTDVHIYQWDEWAQRTIPVPMQVGHEYVGTIVELGKSVKGLRLGDRVSGEGHLVCGHCRNCRAGARHLCINTRGIGVNVPGCFAEFLALPAENVFPLPDDVTDDEASILDPLGNAVHTALSFDLVGEDVLVTGAGPIGIMGALVAQYVGAKRVIITDVNPYRLELAQKAGVKHCLNPQKENLRDLMKTLNMKEGFDIGLEMSGNIHAFSDMLDTVKAGAKIALLGILPANAGIPWDKVIFKGLFIKGIYGREMFETWYKMTSLLQSGFNIDPVITHRFPIDRYEEGFETMSAGNSGKIILYWE